MNERSRGRLSALTGGWLGVAIIPLIVLADTAIAVGQGWAPGSVGIFAVVPKLMWAWLIAATLLLLVRGFRDRLRGRSGQLLALGVSTLVGCGLAEAYLRATRAVAEFHLRPAGAVYAYEANSFQLPGVFDKAQTTINSRGVRGPELPADRAAYRVLCVGGSSTECYYLDDSEAWPAILSEKLSARGPRPVWTGAAGYSEYATAQHARFVAESPLIGEVDCVVVLTGVNDILQSLLGQDARRDLPGPLWHRSRLVDLVKETWNLRLGMGFVVDFDGSRISLARLGREIRPRPLDVEALLADYEFRVRELVAAAKRRNVRLVLVTQPVLWDDFLSTLGLRRLRWARAYPYPREWEQLEAGALRILMDKYNERLRATATDTGTEIVDAAPKMTAIEMHFYDDFHLNETGCRTLGELLAEAIQLPAGP